MEFGSGGTAAFPQGGDVGSDRRTGRQGPRLASQVSRTRVVESGDLTVQLIFAGPLVLLTYVVAFAMTPGDRASADYPRQPRKSCDGRSAERFGHEFG